MTPPLGRDHPLHPPMAVSQSVCLPFPINKPLRPQLLQSGAKNSSGMSALTQEYRELGHQPHIPPTLCWGPRLAKEALINK